jgi:hypothetical protein
LSRKRTNGSAQGTRVFLPFAFDALLAQLPGVVVEDVFARDPVGASVMEVRDMATLLGAAALGVRLRGDGSDRDETRGAGEFADVGAAQGGVVADGEHSGESLPHIPGRLHCTGRLVLAVRTAHSEGDGAVRAVAADRDADRLVADGGSPRKRLEPQHAQPCAGQPETPPPGAVMRDLGHDPGVTLSSEPIARRSEGLLAYPFRTPPRATP